MNINNTGETDVQIRGKLAQKSLSPLLEGKKELRVSEIERDHLQFGLLWCCGSTGVLSPSWSCGKTCPLEMLEALLLIYMDAECNSACRLLLFYHL